VVASRRQVALLGAALFALALVIYWQSSRQELTPAEYAAAMSRNAGTAVDVLGSQTPAPARPRVVVPEQIPAVGLASLERAQPEPSDTGRDPFRFEAAPAPAPRAGPAGPAAAAPAPAQPAAPLEPPGPPPIPLKFIGIAKQGQGRLLAVLRDERGIYYGAEGDVVEGRYRILRVSAEMVEMSYLDGRGRTSIPLSGGRPEPAA
jgi:hypothetical protein